MASNHKDKKPATGFLEQSASPLQKPSLGILDWLLLYARIPQPPKPTHLSLNRLKSYETLAVASALLTTQSYLGQGLVEQYVRVPVRTQLNPDTEFSSQATHTFSHLTLKGGGKHALFQPSSISKSSGLIRS